MVSHSQAVLRSRFIPLASRNCWDGWAKARAEGVLRNGRDALCGLRIFFVRNFAPINLTLSTTDKSVFAPMPFALALVKELRSIVAVRAIRGAAPRHVGQRWFLDYPVSFGRRAEFSLP